MPSWPHDDTQSLIAFYGDPRQPGFTRNLVLVVPPWPMTYEGRPIRGVQIHRRCAESLKAVFDAIAAAVGYDWSKLPPAATCFDGSYNFRPVRGSSRLSCHAFGAAIDLDAAHNPMNTAGSLGTMSPVVIEAFKRQGWYWGGDFSVRKDPMHFQAAQERSAVAEIAAALDPISSAQAAEMPPMIDGHGEEAAGEPAGAAIEELPQAGEPPAVPPAAADDVEAPPLFASLRSFLRSRMAWMQATLLAAFGLDGGTQIDAGFFDKLKAIVSSRGFLSLLVIVLLVAMLFMQWREHTRQQRG